MRHPSLPNRIGKKVIFSPPVAIFHGVLVQALSKSEQLAPAVKSRVIWWCLQAMTHGSSAVNLGGHRYYWDGGILETGVTVSQAEPDEPRFLFSGIKFSLFRCCGV
jgi:hypothetical protein